MKAYARKVAAVLGLVGLFAFFAVGSASAAVDPGTTAAITGGFDDLKTVVVTVLAVALFAIAVAALAIKMGVKWLRKGAGQ